MKVIAIGMGTDNEYVLVALARDGEYYMRWSKAVDELGAWVDPKNTEAKEWSELFPEEIEDGEVEGFKLPEGWREL